MRSVDHRESSPEEETATCLQNKCPFPSASAVCALYCQHAYKINSTHCQLKMSILVFVSIVAFTLFDIEDIKDESLSESPMALDSQVSTLHISSSPSVFVGICVE